jgi:hypothetical protein
LADLQGLVDFFTKPVPQLYVLQDASLTQHWLLAQVVFPQGLVDFFK